MLNALKNDMFHAHSLSENITKTIRDTMYYSLPYWPIESFQLFHFVFRNGDCLELYVNMYRILNWSFGHSKNTSFLHNVDCRINDHYSHDSVYPSTDRHANQRQDTRCDLLLSRRESSRDCDGSNLKKQLFMRYQSCVLGPLWKRWSTRSQ